MINEKFVASLFKASEFVDSEDWESYRCEFKTDSRELTGTEIGELLSSAFPEDEVFFCIKGDGLSATATSKKDDPDALDNALEALNVCIELSGEANIEVVIRKKQSLSDPSAIFNIYSMPAFLNWLMSLGTYRSMLALNSVLSVSDHVLFRLINEEWDFETGGIAVVHDDGDLVLRGRADRRSIVARRNSISRTIGIDNFSLLPDDFDFFSTSSSLPADFVAWFDLLRELVSLISIVAHSRLSEDAVLIGVTEFSSLSEFQIEKIIGSSKVSFYDVYKWLYARGDLYVRSTLLRDVLDRNKKWMTTYEQLGSSFEAARSLCKLVSHDDVDRFFDSRRQVLSFVEEQVRVLLSRVHSLLNAFMGSMAASIAVVSSLAIFDGRPIREILLSDGFRFTSLVAFMLSALCGILSWWQAKKEEESILRSKAQLDKTYKDLFPEQDERAAISGKDEFEDAVQDCREQRRIILLIWIALCAGGFIVVLLLPSVIMPHSFQVSSNYIINRATNMMSTYLQLIVQVILSK